jgi:hypothetical protein
VGSSTRGRAGLHVRMAVGHPGPGLSDQADPPRGAVPAGRAERRHRPGGRPEDAGPARAVGDHRQPCRRRWRDRHRLRGEIRSRRLHYRHRQRRRARDQLQPAGQDPLRSPEGPEPDHLGRQGAGTPGRLHRCSGRQRQGAGRARQGQARANQFRLDRGRQHAPSRRRAAASMPASTSSMCPIAARRRR